MVSRSREREMQSKNNSERLRKVNKQNKNRSNRKDLESNRIGSIPGSGRSPGEGSGKPLQYSCLEKTMDRGALQATEHVVTNGWTCVGN